MVVRINRPWRMAVRDIEASVGPAVVALNLPKVPDAGHVRAVAEILDELEAERGLAPGHTRLVVMIETAEGLINMAAIAAASERVVALTVGAEDLALDMGMRPIADALYVPNVQAVAAARAAGILPIGYVGTVADYEDEARYRETAERARRLGFAGGFCIHPKQVPILNAAFSPSAGRGGRRRGAGRRLRRGERGRQGGGQPPRPHDRPAGRRAGPGLARPPRGDRRAPAPVTTGVLGTTELGHPGRLPQTVAMMNLRDLRYFVAVAESGSILAASEKLHVAQPSISVRIRTLEGDLGVALFERRPRGVVLTEEGEELLVHARLILDSEETARESLRRHAASPVGTVNFGVPTSLSSVLSVPLVEETLAALPNVRLRIVESMTGYIIEWLRNGQLDLGLVFVDNPISGVQTEKLLAEDLHVAAARPRSWSRWSMRAARCRWRSSPACR